MTVGLDICEKPSLIIPKKRTSGKKAGSALGHADHIIIIQGVSNPAQLSSIADTVGILENHKTNGIKNHIADLPSVPDSDDDGSEHSPIDPTKDGTQEKFQALPKSSTNYHSREIVDLSPIYENSSDTQLNGKFNDICTQKSCKLGVDENNDSNSTTLNNSSRTQSETSLEMGVISDGSFPGRGGRRKKKVNIVSESSASNEDTIEIDRSGLSSPPISPEKSTLSSSTDGYLTMTGTIKRGKKKGQNIDVKLNISREELEDLEAAIAAKEIDGKRRGCECSPTRGLHVAVWTVLCMPVAMLLSGLYSFYIGTLTWYNIFVYASESKRTWLKATATPLAILLYPFLISIFTIGLGIYSGIAQITCSGRNWWREICDLEKGFYGWFCSILGLSDCSPYEVVILTDLKAIENADVRGNSSTEDVSA